MTYTVNGQSRWATSGYGRIDLTGKLNTAGRPAEFSPYEIADAALGVSYAIPDFAKQSGTTAQE